MAAQRFCVVSWRNRQQPPTSPPPLCAQPPFPLGPSASDTHTPQPDWVSVKAQTGMHKWSLWISQTFFCGWVCVYFFLHFYFYFFILLLEAPLQHEIRINWKAVKTLTKEEIMEWIRNGLGSLPCLPTAWTTALGKKKDSSLLISLSLSPVGEQSRPPLPTSIPPSFLLSFFFFDSVSFHSEDSVFVLQTGLEAVYPWRIQSGLQSCDDCSHECSHLASLAPFFLSLAAPNLATVAVKSKWDTYMLPVCLEETLIRIMFC